METYHFISPRIEKLIKAAVVKSWNVYDDTPWEQGFDPELLRHQNVRSLIETLPEYTTLSSQQQQELKVKEVIYHISNLLAGEHMGTALAAQIVLECPQDSLDWSYFGSTVLADERNHALALIIYLKEKIGYYYQPHPQLQRIFAALMAEADFEIKLFVAQISLEWTAVSLLSSLLLKNPEPLLSHILKRIIHDEGRHLAFNHWVFSQLSSNRISVLQKPMEDLFFESIVAITSSFFSIPVWQEYGFSKESCRQHAVQNLEQFGVLRYYTKVLQSKFSQCGFKSERIVALLNKELVNRLLEDQWSFEPIIK